MTLTSFATAKNNKVGDKVTLYEDHETIVEMYTDLSGNRILNQYLNGKLIQRDTLLTSSPNSIKRDFSMIVLQESHQATLFILNSMVN